MHRPIYRFSLTGHPDRLMERRLCADAQLNFCISQAILKNYYICLLYHKILIRRKIMGVKLLLPTLNGGKLVGCVEA